MPTQKFIPTEANELLKNNFKEIFYLFLENRYMPQTFDDANYFLMQNIFELDKTDKISVDYEQDGLKHIDIYKDNFYNAYFYPIWISLSLKQRAQIVKWHFDKRIYELNLKNKDINLRFFIHKQAYDNLNQNELKDIVGMFYDDNVVNENSTQNKFYLYINPETLNSFNPYFTVNNLEHELTHVKQEKLKLRKMFVNKSNCNLFEKELNVCGTNKLLYDYLEYLNCNESKINYLLYANEPVEKSANMKGVKEVIRLHEQNRKENLFDDYAETLKNDMVQDTLFHLRSMKPEKAEILYNFPLNSGYTIEDYKNDYEFVQNAPRFFELLFERTKLLNEKDIDKKQILNIDKQANKILRDYIVNKEKGETLC